MTCYPPPYRLWPRAAFLYLLHLYVIHGLVIVFVIAMNQDPYPFLAAFDAFPSWWGFNLPTVYLVWIGVTLLLYPVSRWFGAVKARHKDSWWSATRASRLRVPTMFVVNARSTGGSKETSPAQCTTAEMSVGRAGTSARSPSTTRNRAAIRASSPPAASTTSVKIGLAAPS